MWFLHTCTHTVSRVSHRAGSDYKHHVSKYPFFPFFKINLTVLWRRLGEQGEAPVVNWFLIVVSVHRCCCITMSMSYAVLLDFFSSWNMYVFMYVLCVWLVHKCAKLESDGRWRAKLSAFCIGFYETQITYENLPEIQEIRHYSNEGKYVLLPRYQLPSTIIKIIAHIYDINAIEILIDLLHIYSMFTGTQLQRSKCIHLTIFTHIFQAGKATIPLIGL